MLIFSLNQGTHQAFLFSSDMLKFDPEDIKFRLSDPLLQLNKEVLLHNKPPAFLMPFGLGFRKLDLPKLSAFVTSYN
jgi:hypothetical protein